MGQHHCQPGAIQRPPSGAAHPCPISGRRTSGTIGMLLEPGNPGTPHSSQTASLPGGVNDGQELWDKLVKLHPNFKFTFNGHTARASLGSERTGASFLTDFGDNGNYVHQMLFNAQHVGGNGGGGWIRLIEFTPGGLIQVKPFRPTSNRLAKPLANSPLRPIFLYHGGPTARKPQPPAQCRGLDFLTLVRVLQTFPIFPGYFMRITGLTTYFPIPRRREFIFTIP